MQQPKRNFVTLFPYKESLQVANPYWKVIFAYLLTNHQTEIQAKKWEDADETGTDKAVTEDQTVPRHRLVGWARAQALVLKREQSGGIGGQGAPAGTVIARVFWEFFLVPLLSPVARAFCYIRKRHSSRATEILVTVRLPLSSLDTMIVTLSGRQGFSGGNETVLNINWIE